MAAAAAAERAGRFMVAVRLRPLWDKERERQATPSVHMVDQKLVVVTDPGHFANNLMRQQRLVKERKFAFDCSFDDETPTHTIHEAVTSRLVRGVIDGFNATVFAYGPTGSGKTFTMLGTPSSPGIMVLTLRDLYSALSCADTSHTCRLSYIEVYNETIRDLLSAGPPGENLDLREDPLHGMSVAGCSEHPVKDVSEVIRLLSEGNRRRTQEPTAANRESSRSHAVLQILVQQKESNGSGEMKIGKLSLIDLAGSERAANTQNRGLRLQEGANINRSLLSLGNCITALVAGKGSFVPYRDSKLTRLLKDSLGGNCRTVMIGCISPSAHAFEETLNTLNWCDRAKAIKADVVVPNIVRVNYAVAEYESLIGGLRAEVSALRARLATGAGNGGGSGKGAGGAASALSPSPPRRAGGLALVSGAPAAAVAERDSMHERVNGGVGAHHISFEGGDSSRRPATAGALLRGAAAAAAGESAPPLTGGAGASSASPATASTQSPTSAPEEAKIASLREELVVNYQERMQLRRSLAELQAKNVENQALIAARQVRLARWEHAQRELALSTAATGSNSSSGGSTLDGVFPALGTTTTAGAGAPAGRVPVPPLPLTSTASPGAVVGPHGASLTRMGSTTRGLLPHKDAALAVRREVLELQHAIVANGKTKVGLLARLDENEKIGTGIRNNLEALCSREGHREVLSLEYRVNVLELEKVELEQGRLLYERMVQQREAELLKLRLQLRARDRALSQAQDVLSSNNLAGALDLSAISALDDELGAAGGPDAGDVEAVLASLKDNADVTSAESAPFDSPLTAPQTPHGNAASAAASAAKGDGPGSSGSADSRLGSSRLSWAAAVLASPADSSSAGTPSDIASLSTAPAAAAAAAILQFPTPRTIAAALSSSTSASSVPVSRPHVALIVSPQGAAAGAMMRSPTAAAAARNAPTHPSDGSSAHPAAPPAGPLPSSSNVRTSANTAAGAAASAEGSGGGLLRSFHGGGSSIPHDSAAGAAAPIPEPAQSAQAQLSRAVESLRGSLALTHDRGASSSSHYSPSNPPRPPAVPVVGGSPAVVLKGGGRGAPIGASAGSAAVSAATESEASKMHSPAEMNSRARAAAVPAAPASVSDAADNWRTVAYRHNSSHHLDASSSDAGSPAVGAVTGPGKQQQQQQHNGAPTSQHQQQQQQHARGRASGGAQQHYSHNPSHRAASKGDSNPQRVASKGAVRSSEDPSSAPKASATDYALRGGAGPRSSLSTAVNSSSRGVEGGVESSSSSAAAAGGGRVAVAPRRTSLHEPSAPADPHTHEWSPPSADSSSSGSAPGGVTQTHHPRVSLAVSEGASTPGSAASDEQGGISQFRSLPAGTFTGGSPAPSNYNGGVASQQQSSSAAVRRNLHSALDDSTSASQHGTPTTTTATAAASSFSSPTYNAAGGAATAAAAAGTVNTNFTSTPPSRVTISLPAQSREGGGHVQLTSAQQQHQQQVSRSNPRGLPVSLSSLARANANGHAARNGAASGPNQNSGSPLAAAPANLRRANGTTATADTAGGRR